MLLEKLAVAIQQKNQFTKPSTAPRSGGMVSLLKKRAKPSMLKSLITKIKK